jgi:hypothetical protein
MTIRVTLWKRIKAAFLKDSLKPEDYVRPAEPTNCPQCNGKIVRKETGNYVCIGFANQDEILELHPQGSRMIENNPDLHAIPPCGWHGHEDDYGKAWM